MSAFAYLERRDVPQLSPATMGLRYPAHPIPPFHKLTNTTDAPQSNVALHKPQLQTLSVNINDAGVESPIHLCGMDRETLERLGALRLETYQKQPKERSRRSSGCENARREGEEITHGGSLPKATARPTLPRASPRNDTSHIPSRQAMPNHQLGSVQTALSRGKAAIPHDVTTCAPRHQSGHGFATPQQTSNPLHFESGLAFTPSNGTGVPPQHHKLRPKAPPFVPQRTPSKVGHSEIDSSARSRKASLLVFHHRGHPPNRINKAYRYTKAGPADSTLPIRSKRLTGLPPPTHQAFLSLGTRSRGCDGGDKQPLKVRDSIQKQELVEKRNNPDELIHLPAPEPTKAYLAKANSLAARLPFPQSLLLFLDLNGTLLYRTKKALNYVPRPGLESFLDYCFANHNVLIWSSARPHNVAGVCKKVFNPVQHELLLGQWGRDTLGLTPKQYHQRVQVYKHLDFVWSNVEIQSRHPGFPEGGRWGQHNTVLIDDSATKAAAQPFNLIEVPEFVSADDAVEVSRGTLGQVVSRLEEVRLWTDVSAIMRAQLTEEKNGKEQDRLPFEETKSRPQGSIVV